MHVMPRMHWRHTGLRMRDAGAGAIFTGWRDPPRAVESVTHAFDRGRAGDAAGGAGQRLSGTHAAALAAAAVAAGPDCAGRDHCRRVRAWRRPRPAPVLHAVPAAAAVPGRLAHSEKRTVPRSWPDPAAGTGPGGVHGGGRRPVD